MYLKGILSISGYPGLYKLISQGKTSIIVESLIDKKRMPAYASSKISALEDIAIFTDGEEVPLKQIFKSIFKLENGGIIPTEKINDKEIKNYFETVLPSYDKIRVYVSDMKKVMQWYNLLHSHNLLNVNEMEDHITENPDEIKDTTPKE